MAYSARGRPQFIRNPSNPLSYMQLFPKSMRKYLIAYMVFWILVGTYFIYTGLAVYLFKLAYASVFGVSMRPMHDILGYFPEVKDDATGITWSHATNSKKLLHDALNGANRVMVIESDILMKGGGTSQQELVPIMAHPPATDSDLTFEEYLTTVIASNHTVGVKLDFKAIEVVELCLQRVARMADRMPGPVVVNADILRGPGSPADKAPIDHRRFLRLCSELTPTALLSVGWTTGYPAAESRNSYGWQHVVPMWELLNLIRSKSTSETPLAVTYPVRASLLPGSLTQLHWLADSINGVTSSLTVWMALAPGEPDPDAAVLRRYLATLGSKRLFVDLPGFSIESISGANASDTSDTSPQQPSFPSNVSLAPLQADDWSIVASPAGLNPGFGVGAGCVAGRVARLSLQSRLTPPAPTLKSPLRLVGDAQFATGALTGAGVNISLIDGAIRISIDSSTSSATIVEIGPDGTSERQRRRAALTSPPRQAWTLLRYSLVHSPDKVTVEVAFGDDATVSTISSANSLTLRMDGLLDSRRSLAYAPLLTVVGGGGGGGGSSPLVIMAVCHLKLIS